jgi:predicted O-linked N-acetylglucosamine transferase (SPINDLY family)
LIVHLKALIGDWSSHQADIGELLMKLALKEKVMPPMGLLSITDDPQIQLEAAQIFSNAEYPENTILGPAPKHQNSKIKVAYFSADFKDHPVAYLTAELFELHDREHFEIYAFSTRKSEPSPIKTRLINAFDHFIEVDEKSDKEVALLARELQIDIAVDLGGHTQHARTNIFAHRAAPIQVNYLGFAGTMGADYFDYIVADRIVIPAEFAEFYLEKKVYLPNSYMVDDSQRAPSSRQFSRSEFGLPEDGVIFCCFNNSYKFNPPRIASFAKILANTPNSVMWITENNTSFKTNLLAEFNKLGIAEQRIIFAGKIDSMADHLARYRLADIFLDTSPYNAHTTALDSLKAGVPIISVAGKGFASRVGASLLTTIGLPELIVHSEEEFIELASRIAQDPQALKLLKEKLSNNLKGTPLFNTKIFCGHLEAAYQEIYQKYMQDLPLADIYINQ